MMMSRVKRSWSPTVIAQVDSFPLSLFLAGLLPGLAKRGLMSGVILVVDDNQISRELLTRRLVREGFEVVNANHAQGALEALQLHPVDVMLLDLHLPDLSGLEVLSRVRAHSNRLELPILMISAADDVRSIVRSIDLGANDYLTKPVQFEVLFAKLRQHLALRPQVKVANLAELEELPPVPELGPGDRLAHYLLVESIGRGGMGEVFRAHDQRLHREVAIKLITQEPKPGVALQRFYTEARAVARVDHTNVVKIYEIGLKPCRFLAMELIPGVLLSQFVTTASVAEICRLHLQLLDALQAVHLQGVVHRDLKPANLMVTPEGVLKVMDFGLARTADEDPMQANTTSLYGTPFYMAPECFDRKRGRVDSQSDLFAVAAILYECLTGERAFEGDNLIDLVHAITDEALPDPRARRPELSQELVEVIWRGMDRDKKRRFATAREFFQALRSCPDLDP
jgi:CheY-like chemotaxis protein